MSRDSLLGGLRCTSRRPGAEIRRGCGCRLTAVGHRRGEPGRPGGGGAASLDFLLPVRMRSATFLVREEERYGRILVCYVPWNRPPQFQYLELGLDAAECQSYVYFCVSGPPFLTSEILSQRVLVWRDWI